MLHAASGRRGINARRAAEIPLVFRPAPPGVNHSKRCGSANGFVMRTLWLALTLSFAGTANAVVSTQQPGHPYRRHWKHATFGKRAIAGTAAGAAISRHRAGGPGIGKRLGEGFAAHAVGTTVEHAVAAPLHEDLHYHRSTKRGFGPRLRHALASTVVTRNTKNGKHTAAVGRLSGHAAAGAVSQAWLPAAGGASTAGIGLAVDAGANVGREFWPHHRRRKVKQRG